ncbi:MAG: hypothetical protein OXB97_14015, partial [Rhodospirillales bacterium]|nr:hypothetical protein [Rhodospirillales bacterium]
RIVYGHLSVVEDVLRPGAARCLDMLEAVGGDSRDVAVSGSVLIVRRGYAGRGRMTDPAARH